ncbi:twin-arginine translocation signal domain-containing protein [Bradyrhizobium uaiense]|uniref:Twin-arginine translocation signal domain-containing protein n=1 Tax=Bradyrhizobium uaiense TaxID=2594946 RepID=A0A6P1BZ00_9BRAD|nr:twin-arginine translocation signal domain-containing protein [Bradyrhizobium uaiense]NEV03240.1 twin-arginine translocation signal domain-containing protein [Bradyrhizobium uaiense]
MSHHLISRRQMLAGTAAAGAVGLTGFPDGPCIDQCTNSIDAIKNRIDA